MFAARSAVGTPSMPLGVPMPTCVPSPRLRTSSTAAPWLAPSAGAATSGRSSTTSATMTSCGTMSVTADTGAPSTVIVASAASRAASRPGGTTSSRTVGAPDASATHTSTGSAGGAARRQGPPPALPPRSQSRSAQCCPPHCRSVYYTAPVGGTAKAEAGEHEHASGRDGWRPSPCRYSAWRRSARRRRPTHRTSVRSGSCTACAASWPTSTSTGRWCCRRSNRSAAPIPWPIPAGDHLVEIRARRRGSDRHPVADADGHRAGRLRRARWSPTSTATATRR